MSTAEEPERWIPCTIESGVWRLVAQALFKDKKAVMRELVSNACDAIVRRLKTEPDAKKKIMILYQGRDIICEDWGTGIVDLYQFQRISVPSYTFVDRDKEEIGYFGVGKTSFVLMSADQRVMFVSVNYENGMTLTLGPDPEDKISYTPPKYRDRNELMDHQGLRVIIKNVPHKQRMSAADLAKYLGEVFAPKIMLEGFEIIIRDQVGNQYTVQPTPWFQQPQDKPLFMLPGQIPIFGILKKGIRSKGKVHIFRRGVKITDSLSAEYKISDDSYLLIESDAPPIETITAGRDSLQIDSNYYHELMAGLKEYLKRNRFEKIIRGTNIDNKGNKSMAKDMWELFEDYKVDNPYDTMPDLLDKELKRNKGAAEQITHRRLSSQRKKRGPPTGKVTKKGNKTGKKRRKRRHYIQTTMDAEFKTDVGEVIKFVPVQGGADDCDPIQYNEINRWYDVHVDRPFAKMIVRHYASQRPSRADKNMLAYAMALSSPDNRTLTRLEFGKKLWRLIDRNLERRNEEIEGLPEEDEEDEE